MKTGNSRLIKNIITGTNRIELFVLISLLYLLSAVIVNEYVIHDDLYYRSLGEHMNLSVIDELISIKNKWQWTGYLAVPVILFLKFLVIGTFISMGMIMAGHKLRFKEILAITMIAEFAWLGANFAATMNLMTAEINTLEDLQVSSLSLASVLHSGEIEKYLFVPLQSINIFLVLYTLLLSWCYKIAANCSFNKAFTLILSTFGTAFILWNILVMYLLISYT